MATQGLLPGHGMRIGREAGGAAPRGQAQCGDAGSPQMFLVPLGRDQERPFGVILSVCSLRSFSKESGGFSLPFLVAWKLSKVHFREGKCPEESKCEGAAAVRSGFCCC